ncbi:MAG TPA: hypothetical protein PKK96_12730 [Anaerolineales bacterium]|nr:hypothetical protein [Anaerolineales bacterium]HMS00368.1 hypothetical protein [Anaerolineales bacterium]HNQ94484.1 hypothetical protein [Anaerolineales bacterium]HNS61866.1 hypothetical protein [Anaerolineales bacterium]
MNATTRIFGMLVWLGGLILTGAVLLSLTAARVGEHKSSTYGNAYEQFKNSWGGEIGIIPPLFTLRHSYTESTFNKDAKQYEDVVRTETYPLVPKTINIDSSVDYGEQELDLLVFNAFETHNTETYTIVNKTQYTGDLLIKVSKPENANLMYDYTIRIPSQGNLILQPSMDAPQALIPGFAPGSEVEVIVTYATKGMDVFKYNLSAYQNNVIERITAKVVINVDEFGIYRFGLPHNTELTKDGATVEFDVENFSTTQDLGITFLAKQRYLDSIQNLIGYSPMSLAFFLIVTFIFSQIFAVKFNAFHYLFVGMIDLFYFLFVAYLIRFFGVFPTFTISIVLTAAMFLLYAPNVFGRWFAFRIVGVFLFLLTVVFSLIFLMPIFRGLLFVVLVFLIFMSIMVFVSRSDISKWSIVSGE